MKITINGQVRDWSDRADLKSVIEHFTKDAKRVIAEVNGQIVRCDHWSRTPVSDGDTIELVNFVGGG